MSESTVRAAIKTILESVTGIGQVHDYERTSRSLGAYLGLMRASGSNTVHGWTIRRRSTSSERAGANNLVRRRHVFEINGIYSVDDANGSEKTWQAMIEAIYTAFKSDYSVGGTCENSGMIQVEDVDFAELGQTLYHTAALTIQCVERDTYTVA